MNKLLTIYPILLCIFISSCNIYSFTGANVDADNINIYYIENKAKLTSPYLPPELTQKLKERVQNLTKLQILDIDSTDLSLQGTIVKYNVEVAALDNIDEASQNRLKVAVEFKYKNKLEPNQNYSRTFERFADFSTDVTLQEVEQNLLDEIIGLLVNDVFNATFANW